MVTTALHHIASDDEIVGILAHELSHAKDRDVRRLTRARLLLLFVTLALTVGASIGVQFFPAGNALTLPVAITTMVSECLFSPGCPNGSNSNVTGRPWHPDTDLP